MPLDTGLTNFVLTAIIGAAGSLFLYLLNRAVGRLDADVLAARAEATRAREDLAAYKLEVAKSYASTGYLKDVEARLMAHLVRIEAKLDDLHQPRRLPAE